MTMLDTGIYGAKVQSWRRVNPRDLLKRLIEKNPTLERSALLAAFRDKVRDDDEGYLDSIIEYWFSNNYHSLVERAPEVRMAEAAQTREKVEKIKGLVTAKIEQRARMILLDMVLPNEKALRDCTGKECAALGPKVGAWLSKIGKQVKPNQIVGDVLGESAIRKLYES